jgi:hypothetical protein
MKEDEDEVEAREGACSMETAMARTRGQRARDLSEQARPGVLWRNAVVRAVAG